MVIYISEQLRDGQIRGFEHAKKKKLEELAELKEKLTSPRAKKRNLEDLEREVASILKGEKVETVVKCLIRETSSGRFDLEWQEDAQVYKKLVSEVFGKKILITCRNEWTEEEIISAYFGQNNVEHVFRQLKNPYHNAICPQYHWTDQKIKVHTFMCVIGMLLTQLLQKMAREAGFSYSSDKIIEMLSEVREAVIITLTDLKGKPSKQVQLEEMDEEVNKLYTTLMENNL